MNRQEAYDLIEKHYRLNCLTLVKRLTGMIGRENAEDVVQEAYCRALQYYTSLSAANGNFNQWFSGILQNAVNKNIRDEKSHGMFRDQELDRVSADVAYNRKFLEEIEEEINSKPMHIAFILNCYFFHQYSPADICEIVPESNVAIRQIIWRFRQDMKRKYKEK